MAIYKNHRLLNHAKALRRDMTKEEKHLWYDFLRTYPKKFYKQRIIGNYIADFYCADAKLVIELDGGQHFTDDGISDDRERDRYMTESGLEVLRFSNLDVDRNFEGVCYTIDRKVRSKTQVEGKSVFQ